MDIEDLVQIDQSENKIFLKFQAVSERSICHINWSRQCKVVQCLNIDWWSDGMLNPNLCTSRLILINLMSQFGIYGIRSVINGTGQYYRQFSSHSWRHATRTHIQIQIGTKPIQRKRRIWMLGKEYWFANTYYSVICSVWWQSVFWSIRVFVKSKVSRQLITADSWIIKVFVVLRHAICKNRSWT